ncbi:hypothetical protein [Sphingomonas sp. CARO-RG-8B-R24-01]|uniref:DUF6894 family protein n=1 Tax=Sphingomonas sp. CARO-RG-8B-R24-01 TaxID=2914831 RepID=UPI001F57F781|nr:hypothetical protein [Sphingomonas sp. CARO-RG-8B-R24-01]
MPRYFFDLQSQDSFTRDDTGLEMATVDRARDHASDAAGGILTSDFRAGRTDIRFEIQVEDGREHRVMTLKVTGTVAAP